MTLLGRMDRIVASALRGAVRGYQLGFSWLFRGACRFHPSCSSYAMEALARHGALKGVWLATRRLLRCHPFHPGGVDPVP